MTSFQIAVKPHRRAAARFVAHVRDTLQRRIFEAGRAQAHVAKAINVDRSVLNRELRGRRDISLSRIAEIAWALGDEVHFDLVPIASKGNYAAVIPGVDQTISTDFQSALPSTRTKTIHVGLDQLKGGLVPVSELSA